MTTDSETGNITSSSSWSPVDPNGGTVIASPGAASASLAGTLATENKPDAPLPNTDTSAATVQFEGVHQASAPPPWAVDMFNALRGEYQAALSNLHNRLTNVEGTISTAFPDVHARLDTIARAIPANNAVFDDIKARLDTIERAIPANNAVFDDIKARFEAIEARAVSGFKHPMGL
jgi:hypothetical protein